MNNWLNKIQTRILELANTRWGIWILFMFAFADASFLPLPVTTFFMVLALMNTSKANKYVFVSILGTLAGAVAGYLAGHYAWYKPDRELTEVAHFLLTHTPGFSVVAYNQMNALVAKFDFWIFFAASWTPLPYGIFSISSGVFNINIFIFIFATLVSQGMKYFLLALLILKFQTKYVSKLNPAMIRSR